MEKKSWVCTLITQISLCCAVFLAFNMGQPQNQKMGSSGRPRGLYFISVFGGFRPVLQQTLLLKQMERISKTYKVSFVVNISELGEDDPLTQNGTGNFPSLNIPWYTTTSSKGRGFGYFAKQMKIPHGKTLDIVALDTASLQDSTSSAQKDQFRWLTRTLEEINSDWCLVVGYHPLENCEKNKQMEEKQIHEPLRNMFLQFGVNAYLSGHSCTNYALKGGIAYIGNPKHVEEHPDFSQGETTNGFLLHRVSSLEIVTYFVSLSGEVVYRSALQQRGKQVM